MTSVTFAASRDEKSPAALVLFVGEGSQFSAAAEAVDKAGDGQLGRAMKAANFTGKKGKILEVLAPAGLGASRVLLAGIGESAKADARVFEDLGGEIAARCRQPMRNWRRTFPASRILLSAPMSPRRISPMASISGTGASIPSAPS